MTHHDYDVLIAGAGPVGLLLALDLVRRGVSVALIEKNEEPMPGSKGKGLQPRTQEILEQLDLLDAFLAEGGRYPRIRIYRSEQVREEPYAEWIEPTPDRPWPNILLVPQHRTEALLRARLEALGVETQFGQELIGLEQDDDGVTATLADGRQARTLRARYLVGADGGRSFVRHALAIGFAGETLPRRAIFADARIEGLSGDVWHRWPDASGGQISLCPLPGTPLFQIAIEVSIYGDVDLGEAAVAQLIRSKLPDPAIVVHEVPWRSLLRVNLRLADRYRTGRVFLAGDAAHIHPPTGAQGLNTGVQDAWNLGWKLATVLQGADPALLDTYEQERRPIAAEMLALSGVLLNAWQGQAKTQRGTLTHQLDLNYRHGALAVDLRAEEAALRAGDRAPDAIVEQSGRPVRLFELLRHPEFTVLGYGVDRGLLGALAEGTSARCLAVDPAGCARDGDLQDAGGTLCQTYGLLPGDVVLIRPDGYLAAWAPAAQVPALRPMLLRWIGPHGAGVSKPDATVRQAA